jgi:hypothetical protein
MAAGDYDAAEKVRGGRRPERPKGEGTSPWSPAWIRRPASALDLKSRQERSRRPGRRWRRPRTNPTAQPCLGQFLCLMRAELGRPDSAHLAQRERRHALKAPPSRTWRPPASAPGPESSWEIIW